MWLQYAVNNSGELVYIEQVNRGTTNLHCPYCGNLLTAKKGQRLAAHFAHTGETCYQVRNSDLGLSAYDNFTLHLSAKVLQALRDFDEHMDYSKQALLEDKKLIMRNPFANNQWHLTKLGKIPLGKLPLMLFCEYQELLALEKHDALASRVFHVFNRPKLEAEAANMPQNIQSADPIRFNAYQNELKSYQDAHEILAMFQGIDLDTALTDLRIYRAQMRRVLGLTLYFLEINNGQYHKIGVTSRSMKERLAEIKSDLQPLIGDVAIKVVYTFPYRGNAELYFKHRHNANSVQLGTLTEYFHFDNLKPIMTELRRVKNKSLDDFEQAVLSGLPADIEYKIRSHQTEEDQGAFNEDIEWGQENDQNKRHLTNDDKAFLARHNDVVDAFGYGLSLLETADLMGVTVSAVRRVEQLMTKFDWSQDYWSSL
jgi:hypothetical protein